MTPDQLKSGGWTALDFDGFSRHLSPVWTRKHEGQREVGFLVEAHHANNHMGTLHGGALMTLADIALGYGVVEALGASNCATAQLQIQFVSVARIGEFVICRPELIRKSPQLVFMRGLVSVGDKIIASADGIWKVMEPRAK